MASFSSEHRAPAEVPTGAPSGATIEQTTVSFGFPAVCNDRFNYWLDGPIDLHCRISGLFESIDRLFDIAVLLLSFRLSTFHFSSILLCWHGADFHACSLPFFAFFAVGAKQSGNREIGGITKMSPIGDKIESPLANGYLLMYKSTDLVLTERR